MTGSGITGMSNGSLVSAIGPILCSPGAKAIGAGSWLKNLDQPAHEAKPDETDVNVVDKWVPTVLTAAMITTAIRAAIRPYSMAVAPDSSVRKRENRVISVLIVVRKSSGFLVP